MKQSIFIVLVCTLFLFSCGQSQQMGSDTGNTAASPTDNGKQLFISNCAQCHSLNQDKMAPKLSGAISRWKNDTTQMAGFIKNAQQVINTGSNPYVVKLYHDWHETVMPAFPNLSDKDVKDIISYINQGVD